MAVAVQMFSGMRLRRIAGNLTGIMHVGMGRVLIGFGLVRRECRHHRRERDAQNQEIPE